ncbi:MAG TPA: hypothetical protein PL009_03185, partial [Flavipsychrobacter sp.]|nr:hypothetical protein [Flavipsychrobacter sp.]
KIRDILYFQTNELRGSLHVQNASKSKIVPSDKGYYFLESKEELRCSVRHAGENYRCKSRA